MVYSDWLIEISFIIGQNRIPNLSAKSDASEPELQNRTVSNDSSKCLNNFSEYLKWFNSPILATCGFNSLDRITYIDHTWI